MSAPIHVGHCPHCQHPVSALTPESMLLAIEDHEAYCRLERRLVN